MRRCVFFALLLVSNFLHAATLQKPNVLLILLDDAGYSDVAGFGRNDAPTPNIQSIAQEGVRFTRHYADSTCKPARLALLTVQPKARTTRRADFAWVRRTSRATLARMRCLLAKPCSMS